MRHNQNARRMRGGRNGGGGHNNSGGHRHSGDSQNRRINIRVQTFDSNGPDVRIRGTAYQINEKYVALARDATSAGDRVLAESYLQHAEHYQRFINEMTEEMAQYQQQNPQSQPQPAIDGGPGQPQQGDNMSDLDQGFLVGPRGGNGNGASAPAADGTGEPSPVQEGQPRQEGRQEGRQQGRQFQPRRGSESGAV